MIIDFWENMHLFDNKDVLKQKAREYYTDEFITDYERWKKNLEVLNDMILGYIKDQGIDLAVWKPITFDEFCRSVNDGIEGYIEEFGTIIPDATSDILNDISVQHYGKIREASDAKRFTLSNIISKIKTVKFI